MITLRNFFILIFIGACAGIALALVTPVSLFAQTESAGGLSSSLGTTPLRGEANSGAEVTRSNSEIIQLLNSVSALRLDTSIFSSARFQALQDNTILIPPVLPFAPKNPFLPFTSTIRN